MPDAIKVTQLEASDIRPIMSAFVRPEWHTSKPYLNALLEGQQKGELDCLLARYEGNIAGILHVKWVSPYPPFAEKGIPEIKDLWVLSALRRRGIATALIDEAERRIFLRSAVAGIGVGLYADYGPAQRLYIKRGYNFDGRGLTYKNQPIKPGGNVLADDELVIFLTKERP